LESWEAVYGGIHKRAAEIQNACCTGSDNRNAALLRGEQGGFGVVVLKYTVGERKS